MRHSHAENFYFFLRVPTEVATSVVCDSAVNNGLPEQLRDKIKRFEEKEEVKMPRLEASITIHRPIEEVFAYVVDPNTAAKWQGSVVEAALTSDGPIGVGSTYRYVIQVMGRRLDTRSQITVYEPPKKFAWKGTSGPFPLSGAFACESVEGDSRATQTLDAEPGGFFKIAEPLLMRQQQTQLENDLKKLKELLETRV